MSTWLRTNVIALLALFVALGGTAVAATAAKNSVTSKSIKDSAVKSVDVKDDGLTGKDIVESSLKGVDASKVAGVVVTQLARSFPANTTPQAVVSEAGDTISLGCTATTATVKTARGATGMPVLYERTSSPSSNDTIALTPTESTTSDVVGGHYTITILRPGGGWTTVDVTSVFETDLGTSTDDCWFRGTISRKP